MTESEESAYIRGGKAVWRKLFAESLRELGQEVNGAALLDERNDAIATLRELCEEYGDNDWPDDLHLSDIIEKHLSRYLERSDAAP